VNLVECDIETSSSSTCSDKLNKINSRLRVEATFLFVDSSLFLGNKNAIAISFHDATKMINLIDLDLKPIYPLASIDFFEHTIIS